MTDEKLILRRAFEAQKRIAELQSRREHYLEMATSISGMSENKIRSTDKRSRVETAALELVDLAAELGEQATELVGALREAERRALAQAERFPAAQEDDGGACFPNENQPRPTSEEDDDRS